MLIDDHWVSGDVHVFRTDESKGTRAIDMQQREATSASSDRSEGNNKEQHGKGLITQSEFGM